MKCEICKDKIEETFFGKIKGTHVNGKTVCSKCQKTQPEKLKEL